MDKYVLLRWIQVLFLVYNILNSNFIFAQNTSITTPSDYIQWHYNQLQRIQNIQYTPLHPSTPLRAILTAQLDTIQMTYPHPNFLDSISIQWHEQLFGNYGKMTILLEQDYTTTINTTTSCQYCYEALLAHQQRYFTTLDSLYQLTDQHYTILDSLVVYYELDTIHFPNTGRVDTAQIQKTMRFIWDCDIIILGLQYATNKVLRAINAKTRDQANFYLKDMDTVFVQAKKLYAQLEQDALYQPLVQEVNELIDFYENKVKTIYLPNIVTCFDTEGQPIPIYEQQYTSTVTTMDYGIRTKLTNYEQAKERLRIEIYEARVEEKE